MPKLSRLICLCAGLAVPAYGQDVVKLTVKEAVGRALRESPLIRKSDFDWNADKARLRQQQSGFLPTVKAELNAGTVREYRADSEEMIANPLAEKDQVDHNLYRGKLVLTQPLFSGFTTMNGVAAAQAATEVGELKVHQQRASVAEEALTLYFGIQLSRDEIAAELEVQSLRQNRLREVEALFRQGRATRLDFLQADYSLKAQSPLIRKIEVSLQMQKLKLIRLMGFELDQKLELTDGLAGAYAAVSKMQLTPLAKAYENALAGNREIQIAKKRVTRIERESSAGVTSHLPTLDFVATAEMNSEVREDFNSPENRRYTGELRLTVPLFSGFESFSDMAERRATIESYNSDVAVARETILNDLSQYYEQWGLNQATYEAETANLKLAEESIKNSETLFKVGRATLTEVLDSYGQKLAAHKNVLQSMHDQILLAVKIMHIQGGVFEATGS